MTQTPLISKIILVILFVDAFCFSIRVDAQTWQYVGLDGYRVEHVYAKGDTIWAGTVDSLYQRAIQYSFTGGRDWSKVSDTDTAFGGWLELAQVDPRSCRTIYAIDKKKRGLRSTDAGASWEVLWDDLQAEFWRKMVKAFYVSPHNENLIFCIVGQLRTGGVLDDLYRSTDGGITWDFVGGDFASSSHGAEIEIAFDPVDPTKMYATDDTNFDIFFYTSSNGGISWRRISNLMGKSIDIFIDMIDRDRIYLFPISIRSNDGGYSWDEIRNAFPPKSWISSVAIDLRIPQVLYATLGKLDTLNWTPLSDGIYKSTDGGNFWQRLEGSSLLDINRSDYNHSLFFDTLNQILCVGTNKGLYVFMTVTSIKENEKLDVQFKLFQNYPNPFKSNTTISYIIPQSVFVHLAIHNALGEEMRTLINESQNTGKYTVQFNAVELPSGIYFYRLVTGSKTIVRKAIYTK